MVTVAMMIAATIGMMITDTRPRFQGPHPAAYWCKLHRGTLSVQLESYHACQILFLYILSNTLATVKLCCLQGYHRVTWHTAFCRERYWDVKIAGTTAGVTSFLQSSYVVLSVGAMCFWLFWQISRLRWTGYFNPEGSKVFSASVGVLYVILLFNLRCRYNNECQQQSSLRR